MTAWPGTSTQSTSYSPHRRPRAGRCAYNRYRTGTRKHKVLGGLSGTPKGARVPIPIDLCADWVGALTDAGFDTAAPTAWLAEGLLFYLPNAAETYLIDTVDRLSTEGSALAFEVKLDKDLLAYRDSPLYTSTKHQIGIDLLNLFDREPRPDSAGDLAGKGWSTSVHTPFDFTRRHGRGPLPEQSDALAGNRWVFANKPWAGGMRLTGKRSEATRPEATS